MTDMSPLNEVVQDDSRPLRVMIFPERPDCILFYVPEGARLIVPALSAPFYRKTIADALAAAGVNYRLTESTPGRWKQSMVMLRKAERAETRQREMLRQARQVAVERHGTELARSHAEAMGKKLAVDEQIRELKTKINEAKSRAVRERRYEDPKRFRQWERDLEELKQQSQALQVRLTELKKQEKAANVAASREWNQSFVKAAHTVLPREAIDRVLDAMERLEGEEGEKEAAC